MKLTRRGNLHALLVVEFRLSGIQFHILKLSPVNAHFTDVSTCSRNVTTHVISVTSVWEQCTLNSSTDRCLECGQSALQRDREKKIFLYGSISTEAVFGFHAIDRQPRYEACMSCIGHRSLSPRNSVCKVGTFSFISDWIRSEKKLIYKIIFRDGNNTGFVLVCPA
jgi:hypothetical protein